MYPSVPVTQPQHYAHDQVVCFLVYPFLPPPQTVLKQIPNFLSFHPQVFWYVPSPNTGTVYFKLNHNIITMLKNLLIPSVIKYLVIFEIFPIAL